MVQLQIGDLSFEWDPKEYVTNVAKHGITFEEAATTWLDPLSIERRDDEHSSTEERWLRIANSLRGVLLVVWSTERGSDLLPRIRIIGARRAIPRERTLYDQQTE